MTADRFHRSRQYRAAGPVDRCIGATDVLSISARGMIHHHGTSKERQMNRRSRYRGALLGLAAGDALGTTVEFSAPGSFDPLTDIVGGGPFHLKRGEWT